MKEQLSLNIPKISYKYGKLMVKKMVSLHEHQVVAHCAAYLLANKHAVNILTVDNKHFEEVREIILFDLKTRYMNELGSELKNKIREAKKITLIHKIGTDIEARYITKGNTHQRNIKIEAKGGSDKLSYKIYTMLGQLMLLRDFGTDFWWFGIAVPSSWKKKIHEYMTSQDKMKPNIQLINDAYPNRGLKFYFVEEDGKVKGSTWHGFLNKPLKNII